VAANDEISSVARVAAVVEELPSVAADETVAEIAGQDEAITSAELLAGGRSVGESGSEDAAPATTDSPDLVN